MPVIKPSHSLVTTQLFQSSLSISEKKHPALPLTRGNAEEVSAFGPLFPMTDVCFVSELL